MSTLTIPNSFAAYTRIQSALVNANFAAIASVVNGSLDNSNLSAGAAIAYSKLSLAGSILNSDISASAAIAYSKLSLGNSLLNSDINASAAIAWSKMASLGNSQVVTTTAGGVIQSVASLPVSLGGTGQTTSLAAFDALSPLTTKGDVIVYNGTHNVRLGAGSDGQVMVSDSTQTNGVKWTTLQQGAKNYITFGSFENNSTTGWSLAHSTLTSLIPTSVATAGNAFSSSSGGTAAAGTLSFNPVGSGSQIGGSFSAQLASSGVTTAGDMLISQAYTIDAEDQARCLAFKAFYKVAAGAANSNFSGTSSNSFAVYIYDVTNGGWIQPAGVYNLVQNAGVGIATGTFQTPSNMTQFQIALVAINATTGAVTLTLDDISVGPQITVNSPAIGDSVSWTPTIAGFGTVSGLNAYSRRSGDRLIGNVSFTTGTVNASTATISLGYNGINGNVTVDSNKLPATGIVGHWARAGLTTNQFNFVVLAGAGSTNLTFGYTNGATNAFNSEAGNNAVGNSEYISLYFDVPIAGWSSNAVSSADVDNRICAAHVNGSSGAQTVANADGTFATVIVFTSVIKDTHAAYSPSTGRYTAQSPGFYDIAAGAILSAAGGTSCELDVFVNGSRYRAIGAAPSGNTVAGSVKSVWLNAGDYFDIRPYQNSGGTLTIGNTTYWTWMSVAKQLGPAVVQATESVNVSAYGSTTSVTTSLAPRTAVVFPSVDYSSHGTAAYNNATGVFTAPVSGKYRFCANVMFAPFTLGTTQEIEIRVQVNGSDLYQLDRRFGNGASNAWTLSGSKTINMKAGDTCAISCFSSVATALNGGNENNLSIERVGN